MIILLAMAHAFNAALHISAFEKLYLKSLESTYLIVSKDFQRNIQSALRFGKTIDNFAGLGYLIKDVAKKNPDLSDITISSTDGKVIASLDAERSGQLLPPDLQIKYESQLSADSPEDTQISVQFDKQYHLYLPLRDRDGKWVANVDFTLPRAVIQDKLMSIIRFNLVLVCIILSFTAILIALVLKYFIRLAGENRSSKRRINIFMLFLLGGAQIIYSLINMQDFRTNYLEIIESKTEKLSRLVIEDIEFLLGKGIRLNRLIGIDRILSDVLSVAPEFRDIRIINNEGKQLYIADNKGIVNVDEQGHIDQQEVSDSRYQIHYPLHERGEKAIGKLEINLNEQVIQDKIDEILLDSATVIVISFLFVMELVVFLMILIDAQLKSAGQGAGDGISYHLVRPAAFLFLFAMDLSMSFLPLHMESLYEPIFGLSKEVVIGLPISAEMFFAGMMLIVTGIWMDKKGWHHPFLVGVTLSGIGFVMSGMAVGAIQFILARAIVGLGFGMVMMSVQGFVFSHTSPSTKARGVANLFASIFAGSLCGSAVGGMLAERVGFAQVFFYGVVGILLAIGFLFAFMRQSMHKQEASPKKDKGPALNFTTIMRFLLDRDVFFMLLFKSMPASVIFVGFLFYISPLHLHSIGTSQSNIARALMAYGLIMIYVSPLISKWVDRTLNKKLFIVISGLLGGLGLILFNFYTGFIATVVVILLLSLSHSFGFSSQTVYVLNTDVARSIGSGRVLGLYRSMERLGQVMGPITLGTLIAIFGINTGISLIGVAYIFFTFCFLFGSRSQVKYGTKNPIKLFSRFMRQMTPASLSPEKRYGHAMVAVMAMVAAADGELQESEIKSAQKSIANSNEILKYLTLEEAQSAFESYCRELIDASIIDPDEHAKVLQGNFSKLKSIQTDPWKQNIIKVATEMAMADNYFHPAEQEIVRKIRNTLFPIDDTKVIRA